MTKKIKTKGLESYNTITAILIGSNLMALALIWASQPTSGMITITFLMMIAFTLFFNTIILVSMVLHRVDRIEEKIDDEDEVKDIQREIRLLKSAISFLFGNGFVLTMIAFWVVSYKYLIDLAGNNLIILLLPIVLLILYWTPTVILLLLKITKGRFAIKSKVIIRWLDLILQTIFIVLIYLDYFQVIIIY